MVTPAKLGGLTLAVGLGVAVTTGHGVAMAETPEGGGSDAGVSSAPPAQTSGAPGRPTRSGPLRDRLRLNRSVAQQFSVRPTADTDESAAPAAVDSRDTQGGRRPSATVSSTPPVRGRKPITATAESTLPRFIRPVIERRSESRPEASPQLQRQMQTVNPTAASLSEPVAPALAPSPAASPTPVARPAARIVSSLLSLVGIRPGVSTPAPGVPATPFGRILELIAAARRQIGQRLFNHTPTASVTSSENTDTGVVTGTVATDADGDPLTSTLVAGKEPAHGTVVFDAKGGYVYTPDPTWAHTTGGTDQFTVTVSDDGPGAPFHLHLLSATGHTVTVPVSVVVTPINHVPTVDAKLIGTGIYQVTTHDDDAGDVVKVVATTDAARGSVKDNGDGTFTFTPDAAYAHSLYGKTITDGADQATITFTGTDPYGAQGTDVETATITPVNNPPTVSAERVGVDGNGGVVYRITKGDNDAGDTVTVVATTDETRGSVVDNQDGTFTFTANAKYAHDLYGTTIAPGADVATIVFTARDQFGANSISTAIETIAPVNNAPTVKVVAVDGVPNTYRVTASDVDPGDVPELKATTDPVRGSVVDNQDGTYTFVANSGYAHALAAGNVNIPATLATITFTAKDEFGATGTGTAIGTITPVNHDPTVTAVLIDTKANGTLTYRVTTDDDDHDTVKVVATTDPTKGSVKDNEDGTFTFTPDASYAHGLSSAPANSDAAKTVVTFTGTDGHGGTDTDSANVTITPVNNAPVLVTSSAVGGDGKTVVTILAFDADGDPVTVAVAKPTGGSFGAADGLNLTVPSGNTITLTYTPYAGSPAQQYTFSGVDKYGAPSEGGIVTLAAAPVVNRPPAVSVSAPTTATNGTQSQVYTVTTSDPDGDTVTLTKPADTANITFALSGNTLTATPTATYVQSLPKGTSITQTFAVVGDDGHGNVVSKTFDVTVSGVNHPPSVAQDLRTNPNTSITTGTIAFSDQDNDPLGSNVTFAPNASNLGAATITKSGNTYTISFAPTDAARTAADDGSGPDFVLLSYSVSDTLSGFGSVIQIPILPPRDTRNPGPGRDEPDPGGEVRV